MYHWEFEEPATGQAASLPGGVLSLLEEFLDAMCFDPWEYRLKPGEFVNKIKNLRHLPFGDWGLVSVMIYEPDLLVLVVQVNWAG